MTEPTYSSGVRIDALMYGSVTLAIFIGSGQLRRVVDLERVAVLQGHLVLDRRGRDDQPDVELPLQTLLDHVQVQKAEESAAEPEAQGRRAVFLIRQRGVVDGQLVHGLAQFAVLVGIDRIDRGKDDLLRLLIAGNRFGRRAVEVVIVSPISISRTLLIPAMM